MAPPIYEYRFLIALAASVALEAACLGLICRTVFRLNSDRLPWPRLLAAALGATALTLPYLWFVLPALVPDRAAGIVVGELGATVVEAAVYASWLGLPWRRALVASAAANLVSFGVGWLVW